MPAKQPFSTDWRPHSATDRAVAAFEERFGRAMGVELTHASEITAYQVIPTGSMTLDAALGVGGYTTGRVHELWGPEHAGKTTLAKLAAAAAQRVQPDKMVAWVDMEQTFDPAWATALGVNIGRLWRPPVRTAEDVADMLKEFASSGLCSLLVLDSVGSMIGRVEYEKQADEDTVAIVARIVTRMVRQVAPIVAANGTTVIVINQVRSNVGGYGAAQTTSGGWALKHITTTRLKVARGGSDPLTIPVEGKRIPVGHEVSVKVEKNKVAPYGNVASLWIRNRPTDKYGPVGVDQADEAVVMGLRYGVIQQAGAYYTTPDGERVKSRDSLLGHLRSHPGLVEQVRTEVLAKLASSIGEQPDPDDGTNPDDPLGIAEVM
jgi:recombination protein RecA